jgi:hypothetical protein
MVLSRALSLAAVTLVVGCSAMGQVEAQENLDAGKSPSQIFAGTCTACHKSARGLLKTVAPGSLQGFLRQHYTTSPEMAGVLASYLMSNGAADRQKGAKDGKGGAKPAARPEAGAAQGEPEHAGHKRQVRPAESSELTKPTAEGQMPQAAAEHGPDGSKTRQRLGRHTKPAPEEEAPKTAESKTADKPVEPAKEEAIGGQPATGETAKVEPTRPESPMPESPKPESPKLEATKPEPAKSEESAKPVDSTRPVESAKPAESPADSATADASKESENEALPPSLRRPDPLPPLLRAPAAAAPVPTSSSAAPANSAGGGSSQAATSAAR